MNLQYSLTDEHSTGYLQGASGSHNRSYILDSSTSVSCFKQKCVFTGKSMRPNVKYMAVLVTYVMYIA